MYTFDPRIPTDREAEATKKLARLVVVVRMQRRKW
jgi:hypothetical protein